MGLSHRVALRLYTACVRQKRAAALTPTALRPSVLSGGRHLRRPQPSARRPTLVGLTLLLLLLLPWAPRISLQQAARPLAGVGVVAALTASIVGLYGCQARMADHRALGAEGSDSRWLVFTRRVLLRARRRLLGFETLYMKMKTFSILVNQLVFFSMCERLLLTNQRLSSLYTLMFFNVVAYCVSYVKEVVEREDWSMYVNIARTSNVRHLALSTTKIVLEWTKAVTFLITAVFTLLVFGLEKGLKNYRPTAGYLALTAFYFASTERVSVDAFAAWLEGRRFACFESLEAFYCPALLLASHLFLSSALTLLCLFASAGNLRLVVLSTFTNVRTKYLELRDGCLQPLRAELQLLADCSRAATRSEVDRHDDVCAICLTSMSCARITPCQHLFHADCLRRCLKESNKCPICQFGFVHAPASRPTRT